LQPHHENESWQRLLAQGIRNPEQLFEALAIPVGQRPPLSLNSTVFPLRVPLGYVARMRQGDPDDPLLRQVLPLAAEDSINPGYHLDPVGDLDAITGPGLLQKYHGRALLITTGACAIHCRYCFRRHFPYQDQHARQDNWQEAINRLRNDGSISEVILSGGDPLLLTTAHLQTLTNQLLPIRHIKRLRVHTRMPVVLPERINDGLLDWLKNLPFQIIIVIHANHPAEIDDNVRRALSRLNQQQITLLNQAVLLNGVNDDCDTLVDLSETLFESGVLPYYLHQLDRVQGAGHFEVPVDTAIHLHALLRQRLPGYLLPQLVHEQAGAASKLPLPR
jgi:EF-P beta-lysylation protein EpmB